MPSTKPRAGILTFHDANNYGAVLQAIATVKLLEPYCEAKIINYTSPDISGQLSLIRFSFSIRGVLRFGKDLIRLRSRIRAVSKFREFITQHGNLTPPCKTTQDVARVAESFDILVSGSDQVWNPECQNKEHTIDNTYFLGIDGTEQKIKFSYASSFGDYIFNEDEQNCIRHLLSGFNAISVRERTSAVELSKIMGQDIETVLDPTLMIEKHQWLKMATALADFEDEEFIVVYQLNRHSLNRAAVEYVRNKTNIKTVIVIDQSISTAHPESIQLRNIGPAEFIWLVENAQYVITDSFHGCCFSVLFEKRLVAIAPPKRINRIVDLMNDLGHPYKVIFNEEQLYNTDLQAEFDTKKNLEALRKSSREFLALGISSRLRGSTE